MFVDTKTQRVPTFCQNKKGTAFLQGIWGGLLTVAFRGEGGEREKSIFKSVSIPQPCYASDRDTWAENALCHAFLFIVSYKALKEKENSNLLELISRSLSCSSLQTQQWEKYAQSYLVQNLRTSQISIPIEKRHSLLAFSQGFRPNFSFYLLTPHWSSKAPSQAFRTTRRDIQNTKNTVSKWIKW